MKTEIIIVPVGDQKKAKKFYAKLGFELITEAPMGKEETWVQMGLPGQPTSIALMSFNGIIFETDDIEKEIKKLKKLKIKTGKVDTQPWGKFSWFKDLDGNGLCLHQK
ncbi:MAG: Glyoxalase/bleomycin resistance protein/dioxygenase [Bacteroidetes bacterium]|nr:Glyoxalase/bleomycin resistance protein/dioxygenase [Bacteroidota bacterium]